MARICIPLLVALILWPAHGQGIAGVTRRTTTLERQSAARSFFDAAGVNITGATTTPGQTVVRTTGTPALAVQRPPGRPLLQAARPAPRAWSPVVRTVPAPPRVPAPVIATPPPPVAASRPNPK